MFKFYDPSYLNWVWGAAILFAVLWVIEMNRSRRLNKLLGAKLEFLTATLSKVKRRWHLFLQCFAIACFAVALARPLLGSRQQEVKQTGVEMIIAVDVSNSMLAEDDKPSRLDHAKHELGHFLDLLSGDRIGLIAFAGSAILVCPMTSDHSAIKLFLDTLSTNSVSTQGTDFKDVMDEAIHAFERGGVEGLNGTKPTRVLLVASDGEDNEPGGISEVKKAVDAGIRVFGLGFGSERGAPIPMRDERGNLRGYKKDKSGQVVMSVPSDQGMAKIARAGGGSYYHATFDEGELRSLVADIDKLEKADFKTRMSTEFDEKFQIPLALGLLAALIDLLFGDRRRGAKPWRGRFETSVLAFLFLSWFFAPSRAHAFGPPSIQRNDRGIYEYQNEDYPKAFEDFAGALSRQPFNPAFHLNLGDAFYKNGEIPKATAEWESVEQNPKATKEQKFKAMFNAGNAAVDQKNIPKALEYYQRALSYNPQSLETKTNIELALKEQKGGSGDKEDKNQQQNQNQNQKQNQDQKQSQNDKQQRSDKQNQNQQPQPTPRPTPHGFKSQNLNENDVRRILDELKRQEEEIRAKQYKERRDTPERQIEKDW